MASTETQTISQEGNTLTAKGESSHDVKTILNYYLEPSDGSGPAPTYSDKPETYFKPSFPLEVTVHDISGHESDFTLDKRGFQVYHFPSKEKEFIDEEAIKSQYYADTERLIKEATGASRVHIFDHTIRRPPPPVDSSNSDPRASLRGPVQRVHIDQSYAASLSRVPHHLPHDAEHLLKHRVQIINVWRPIKPIFKDPLAVADAHSVPDSDLVTQALIYPNRKGETYSVRPNSAHRWYFKYGLSPEEVLLIKCFDSKKDGRARRVPHTAFVDRSEEWKEGRESIEVRALVFHEDQEHE